MFEATSRHINCTNISYLEFYADTPITLAEHDEEEDLYDPYVQIPPFSLVLTYQFV